MKLIKQELKLREKESVYINFNDERFIDFSVEDFQKILEFLEEEKYEKNCLGSVARQRCLWALISLALGMSLSPVAALIVAGALVLAPIAGLYFILQKIVIALIRCCQPDFMKPTIVPGYAIG